MERVTFEMYGEEVGFEIIGGTEVPDGVDMPYFVSFVKDPEHPVESYQCAGTAIGSNLVVSAEHCFKEADVIADLHVRIGGKDLREVAMTAQIDKVVVPANPVGDQDIALVSVGYHALSPVRVISPDDIATRPNVYMYGHGDTDSGKIGSQLSPVMKYIDLYQHPPEKCDMSVDEGQGCFTDEGDNVNNVGTGDSGGPAVQLIQNGNGEIHEALRGVIIETQKGNTPDYTVVTDLRLLPNQEFMQQCSIMPELKPELCEVRYDRYPMPKILVPTPTPQPTQTPIHQLEQRSGSIYSAHEEEAPPTYQESYADYVPAALLGLALITVYRYRRFKKQ